MIIKSKPLPLFIFKSFATMLGWGFKWKCKRLNIDKVDIKPGHSYILMCNHFSFWDGLWAFYLINQVFNRQNRMKHLYIMSVKKQMEKKKWLRYMGSFSIDPGRRSITESFEYIADKLSEPGNVFLFYPQGELESCYIRHIKFDEGLYEIVPKIKGDCQLIWSSNIIEYFESLDPVVYSTLLDCGTNHDFDFEALKQKVNNHHIKSIERHFRYTEEPLTYNT